MIPEASNVEAITTSLKVRFMTPVSMLIVKDCSSALSRSSVMAATCTAVAFIPFPAVSVNASLATYRKVLFKIVPMSSSSFNALMSSFVRTIVTTAEAFSVSSIIPPVSFLVIVADVSLFCIVSDLKFTSDKSIGSLKDMITVFSVLSKENDRIFGGVVSAV